MVVASFFFLLCVCLCVDTCVCKLAHVCVYVCVHVCTLLCSYFIFPLQSLLEKFAWDYKILHFLPQLAASCESLSNALCRSGKLAVGVWLRCMPLLSSHRAGGYTHGAGWALPLSPLHEGETNVLDNKGRNWLLLCESPRSVLYGVERAPATNRHPRNLPVDQDKILNKRELFLLKPRYTIPHLPSTALKP